jgi:hypothetical protein
MTDRVKETAREKIESRLIQATRDADNPYGLYWKVDEGRQLELNIRDKFEVEVWSYILTLIEKDNKL